LKKSPLAVIVICFIAGFTTLIYEITWTRILNLVTGSTITAIAVVVAVFMAGLGFGGLIFGRAVDKTRHAFRLFASIQSGIVFFGLSSALLWQPLPGLYSKFYGVFDQSLSVIGILLFSSSLMFVPCFFMGGVLPVLAKAYVRDDNVVASGIGRLYA
jgi:spermidine synthase